MIAEHPTEAASRSLAAAFDGRANNFDALRLILAACVIVSHCFTILYHLDPVSVLTNRQAALGGVAVNGFFVISGFLIARSWENSRSLGDYLARRVRRIYPAFVASSLFCLIVVGPLAAPRGLANVTARPATHLRHILTLGKVDVPHVFPSTRAEGHVNPVVWSIRFEFLCYILVPALAAAGVWRRRHRAAVVFGLVYAINVLFLLQHGFFPDWVRVFCYFTAGVAFWIGRDRVPVSSTLAWICAGMLAIGCYGHLDLIEPLAFSYLLLIAACRRGPMNGAARRADLSYGMYLYGFPVQLLLMRLAPLRSNPIALSAATLLASAAFASASWRWVERPWLPRTRRR